MNWEIKFRLFQASTYLLVLASIILVALVTGKYLESAALFATFVYIRDDFGKTYHSKSFWKCILISVVVFVVSISFVPSRHISLLMCIVFGLTIDYIAYKYQDYLDVRALIVKPFNLNTCTEAELIAKCRELNFSQDNIQLAIEFFIQKLPNDVLASKYCLEKSSVAVRKFRMKTKLNKS